MTAATAALTVAIIIAASPVLPGLATQISGDTTAPDVQSVRQSDKTYFPRPEPALRPSQEYTRWQQREHDHTKTQQSRS